MLKRRHLIYAAAALVDFGAAGIFFAVTRRAAELGATGSQLGALGAIWAGIYGLSVLVTGRLSDRVGRRRLAVIGLTGTAGFIVACGLTTNIPALLLLMAGFGVSISAFWPSIMGWLGDDAKNSAELNARLSRFSTAWTVGFLLGSGLTGAVFQIKPFAAFLMAAAAVLGALVLLLLSVKPDTDTIADTTSLPPVPQGRGFRKTAWLANFAITLTTGGVCALFPQLATNLGIPASVHGSMLALFRAGSLVAFFLLANLTFWRTRLWPLWVAQAVAVIALAGIGISHTTWAFTIAFVVAGLVAGYTYQASIFFTLEEMTDKGKGSGFHEAVLGLGIFLGSLLAGWVGERFSIRSPYYFCAAVLLVLILAQMILVFFRRRAK